MRTPIPVSIVVPTIGKSASILGEFRLMVLHLLDGLVHGTDGLEQSEIVVVVDPDTPQFVRDQVVKATSDQPIVRLVDPPTPFTTGFDFSQRVNYGAASSRHQILVFLNDDMAVTDRRWLLELTAPFDQDDVAVSGGLLMYPDGQIQHAGFITTSGGVRHIDLENDLSPEASRTYLLSTSNSPAVTGAMLAIRRADFEAVGGFSSEFPLSFNDVDLCFKVGLLNRRIVFTPFATMQHYETQSRRRELTVEEQARFRNRWANRLCSPEVFQKS